MIVTSLQNEVAKSKQGQIFYLSNKFNFVQSCRKVVPKGLKVCEMTVDNNSVVAILEGIEIEAVQNIIELGREKVKLLNAITIILAL